MSMSLIKMPRSPFAGFSLGRTLSKSLGLQLKIKQELRIVMSGLDGSGKTTILYKLKFGEIVQAKPTIGFNVETIKYKDLKLTIWDTGNIDHFDTLKRQYYYRTDGLVYIVDSSAPERLAEARDELHEILKLSDLKDCAVLILCNKQDQPNAMSTIEISDKLLLNTLKQKKVHIQQCCVYSGTGMLLGLDWLTMAICTKG